MNEVISQFIVGIADVIVTAILGIIGLYLVHSYRRQQALRVAEKRLTAYAALWSKMRFASPIRLTKWVDQPLTCEAREQLFHDFTAWYFEDGNGMLLGDSTRAIYLRAKDNLVCPVEYYEPKWIRDELFKMLPEAQKNARGYLAIRQLSLLRNRMKADLDVYGLPYHVSLDKSDKEFLKFCGEKLGEKPWSGHKRRFDQACQNIKIFPEESVTAETKETIT